MIASSAGCAPTSQSPDFLCGLRGFPPPIPDNKQAQWSTTPTPSASDVYQAFIGDDVVLSRKEPFVLKGTLIAPKGLAIVFPQTISVLGDRANMEVVNRLSREDQELLRRPYGCSKYNLVSSGMAARLDSRFLSRLTAYGRWARVVESEGLSGHAVVTSTLREFEIHMLEEYEGAEIWRFKDPVVLSSNHIVARGSEFRAIGTLVYPSLPRANHLLIEQRILDTGSANLFLSPTVRGVEAIAHDIERPSELSSQMIGFKKLMLSGIDGDELTFDFHERGANQARPFSQMQVTYSLSPGATFRFKGFQLQLIGRAHDSIQYRLLSVDRR